MTSYWSQFSKDELDSMQRIQEENESNLMQQRCKLESNLMQDEQLSFETLGMSWRDFI